MLQITKNTRFTLCGECGKVLYYTKGSSASQACPSCGFGTCCACDKCNDKAYIKMIAFWGFDNVKNSILL